MYGSCKLNFPTFETYDVEKTDTPRFPKSPFSHPGDLRYSSPCIGTLIAPLKRVELP
jgi:hypothetical protein